MLAGCELLFPGLDLFLSRKCIGLEHALHHLRQLSRARVDDIDSVAYVALDLGGGVVFVRFRLCSYSKLGDFLGRLISGDLLSRTLYVDNQRMAGRLDMEQRVVSGSCAATVEADEANVQASGLVDGIEALSAVFTIDGLVRTRGLEFNGSDMLTGHVVALWSS
jgi:hypothetical protein